MPLELWLAYVATSAVALAITGPTILLVLGYSIAHSRTATLPVVVLATAGATSYALFATSIRRLLASARAQRIYSLVGGGLLFAAGVWALGAKRVISAA